MLHSFVHEDTKDCPKNNLNLCVKTEPFLVEAEAT